MSLRSPRSPTQFLSRQGFQPIPNATSNNMNETDIPLTTVRSASSSTGARKPGEGTINAANFANQPTFKDDEKTGFFKRGSAKGGKRKVKKINSKPRRVDSDGEEQHINALGRLYNTIVQFSVVTKYLIYVLPIAILLAAPIVVGAVLKRNYTIAGVKMYWFFTWIETVWLSIWVSKLVSKAIPGLFMFLCGVVSSGTRKYALVLKALEIPLSLVGWAVTSLVTFTALTGADINDGVQEAWVGIMKKILVPVLIASLLYLGEKLIVQLISVNYHRRSFHSKIKDSKHTVNLLGLLYDASRTLFPMYCPEFVDEDYLINDSIEAMLAKTGGHKRSGSVTPLRFIGDVGRFGDKVTSVFGNIASEITGKQVFNPTSAHSIVVEALEKTKSSEALARRLWMSFVVEGKEALYEDDLREVLGPAHKDEAEECFDMLDGDGNGDISLDEMIMKVVEIGRERKAIANSMRDVGQAIGVLDQVLVSVLFVVVVFVFVAFQDTSFVTTLATAGTTLLSLSFVFSVTTQEFLGSCIFLFVKHPYDVGDRVDIVGPQTEELLVVEQISLLFTVFKRIDSMKMVQVPNIILNNLWIENISRSKAMKEKLDMHISFDTTLEDIEALRGEIEAFVRQPENSRDFQPDVILEACGIGDMDKLQLQIEIRHKSNWHNETVRAARRSKFMCALVLALKKVPIYAPGGGGASLGDPSNPSYSVVVSDAVAAQARDKFGKDKLAKRLIKSPPAPATGKSSGVNLGPASEAKASEAMNSRAPTADAYWSNSTHDDKTLASQDNSMNIGRSNDIDLRESLLKRESTRGRRRPGEMIPPIPTGGLLGQGPGFQVIQASPRHDAGGMLDEEAQIDAPSSLSNNPYAPAVYGGAGYGSGPYAIYPTTPAAPVLEQQQLQQFATATGTATSSSGQYVQNNNRNLTPGLKPIQSSPFETEQ